MTRSNHPHGNRRGFTLIEMTVVIFVLITLISVGFYSGSNFGEWRKARAASDTLRTVYAAQRTFLSDNPTTPVTSITHATLLPYLPAGTGAFPTGTSLTNTALNIFVGASPPFMTASGITTGTAPPARYDPSGSTTDSLWDAGE